MCSGNAYKRLGLKCHLKWLSDNALTYHLCSLTKRRRKYSCQNCVDNDEISKYTKILKKKEQHNEGETNSTVNIDTQIDHNRTKRN